MDEVEDRSGMGGRWPSVDDSKPEEEGGPVARTGFNYQDEIAVGFLVDMLESPLVLKVHCETHDDIVMIRQISGFSSKAAEYIQVKASEQDKLWSVADICQRRKSKVGTSIFETSLRRDRHSEVSSFRLVTLRPVMGALKPLTYDLTAPGRAPGTTGMMALYDDLEIRMAGFKSPKGNGARFWLDNCRWDERHSEEAVRKDNVIRLTKLGHKEQRPLLLEQTDVLLDELRAMAKAAGDAKWGSDRDKKIIERGTLREWWERRTRDLTEGAAERSGIKLAGKMADAGLSDDLIALAVELRRDYAAEVRTPRYLEAEDADRLRRRVQSEVMSLRASFVSGQINIDPPGFHALCVGRMDDLIAGRGSTFEVHSAFLKGCMYDIADRCLLRFTRWPS